MTHPQHSGARRYFEPRRSRAVRMQIDHFRMARIALDRLPAPGEQQAEYQEYEYGCGVSYSCH
jgi:hypothetical protein